MDVVWDSLLCISCLKSGPFTKQCPSLQKCRKCRDHIIPYSTRLTTKSSRSWQSSQSSQMREDPRVVTTHMSQLGCWWQVLLWRTESMQSALTVPPIKLEFCLTLDRVHRSFQNKLHSISAYLIDVKTPRWMVLEQGLCICRHRLLSTLQWSLFILDEWGFGIV